MAAFDTPITLTGPWRGPIQMLQEQSHEGQLSVHDADTAASLDLAGAPIEGPTHFSQFDPLGVELWGHAWWERGCISSHFRTMVVEGEEVQASSTTTGELSATIEAHKRDGTPVLDETIIASIPYAEGNGPAYPFSLAEKAVKITEPSAWYTPDGAADNPWGR